MKCPVCREPDLVMTDRQGIEIDYCPQCRGVWLDRGELDKIIERSATFDSGTSERDSSKDQARYGYKEEHRYKDDDDDRYYGKHRHKKRGGLLGELFDF
jgi:uncharacterized protein